MITDNITMHNKNSLHSTIKYEFLKPAFIARKTYERLKDSWDFFYQFLFS